MGTNSPKVVWDVSLSASLQPLIKQHPSEWQTTNSPTTSTHSSDTETKDPECYKAIRNKVIQLYLKRKKPLTPPQLQQSVKRLKIVLPEEIPPGILDYADNHDVDLLDTSSSSDESDSPRRNVSFLGKNTIKQIVQKEEKCRNEILVQDLIKPFHYLRFHDALKTKWNILEATRVESILKGKRSWDLPVGSDDLQSIYGPVDISHKDYHEMQIKFKITRLEMLIPMLERERKLIEWMIDNRLDHSSRVIIHMANEVSTFRRSLEEHLKTIFESGVDMNPYTSTVRLEYFRLPRKSHPISSYVIRPSELDKLSEFNNLSKGMFFQEGYNTALYDVGCSYPDFVRGDFKRNDYFNGSQGVGLKPRMAVDLLKITHSFPNFNRYLNQMNSLMMNDFKFGVEGNIFLKKFRDRVLVPSDERLFGTFSDLQGLHHVKEVFYVQTMGKGNYMKEILFHGLLEGMIVTPEEILLRIWKRLKFLLEESPPSKLSLLTSQYQECFGQPLFLLNWGFQNVEELILYSKRIFPKELENVEMTVDNEKSTRSNYSWKGPKTHVTMKKSQTGIKKSHLSASKGSRLEQKLAFVMKNEWYPCDESLDDVHFEIVD